MAEKLGEALLDLDTNDKGLRAGITRSERLAVGLGRTFDDTGRRAVALGRNLAVGAAAGAVAMGFLVKRAIDTADEMSKAAQRAGVTTEELSRLAWAGELSDVSLSSLTTSMGRLANVMAQMVNGGAKDTKAIFDGLGISITDADGKLRSAAEILPELAGRFATMENGAEKSALAIQIFGRSGADLIPLLNNGRDGLSAMADEADRLGKTISTKAGRDAEQFNDTMTRIGAVVDGLVLKIGAGILPQLNEFANKLADPAFAQNAQGLAMGVVGAINMVIDIITTAGTKLSEFGTLLEWMATHDWFTGEIDPAKMEARNQGALAQVRGMLGRGQRSAPDDSFLSSIFGGGTSPVAPGDTGTDGLGFSFAVLGSSAAAADDKVKSLIASLVAERDTLRELDPVQQRLISMREQLATATDAQRAEVESLIGTIHEEVSAWDAAQGAGQLFGDQLLSSIEALRTGSKSLNEVLGDVANTLSQVVLQSMLMGQGPLAGIFGTKGAGGGVGGILGSLFSGFFAKGGLIPNGTFGIVGEKGPEPVIGTSQGAKVLPNSTLQDMMGGGGRGDLYLTVEGSGLSQAEMTQAISDAFDRFNRHTLPGRVAEIVSDPLARG